MNKPIGNMWERVLVCKDDLAACVAQLDPGELPAEDGPALFRQLASAVQTMQANACPYPMTNDSAAGQKLEDICGGQYGHDQVASRVRMLYRDDLHHEAVCLMARDRIIWLAARVAELELAAKAEPTMKIYACDYCGKNYTDARYCCDRRREYLAHYGESETAPVIFSGVVDMVGDDELKRPCVTIIGSREDIKPAAAMWLNGRYVFSAMPVK